MVFHKMGNAKSNKFGSPFLPFSRIMVSVIASSEGGFFCSVLTAGLDDVIVDKV